MSPYPDWLSRLWSILRDRESLAGSPGRGDCSSRPARALGSAREPLIYQPLLLGLWDSGGRARLGRTNVRSGELFRSGVRHQEAPDASRDVFGRDGRGGAVAGVAGGGGTALSAERRARSSTGRFGLDAADLLSPAMVRLVGPPDGGRALRHREPASFRRFFQRHGGTRPRSSTFATCWSNTI